jgi:spore germination cell wall hydrolase CwlJ-like protein
MSDETVVAGTAYGEARSLGYEGLHAVCNVIMNRVAKQTWYGLTATEVCLKHSQSGVYQFDCNDPKDPNYDKIQAVTTADPQYMLALKLATDAVAGNLPDITNGALNYYSTTIPLPSWAQGHTPCYTVGNTEFFNDIA